MEPTEPSSRRRRLPPWLELGSLLALGAANKAVHAVTDPKPEAEPEPPPPPSHPFPARWVAVGAVVVLVAGVAALVVGRSEPLAWDERVAPYVRFVEEERGLRFEHPVPTDFLSDEEFREEVTDDEALTAEDEEALDHAEGVLRALGVAEGEIDLREASNQLSGEGIIGLYDPERDRILVRGDRITVGMRPTIVHELTHALQAQHFDLDLERGTSGEDIAFRALVEADAVRIENEYVDSLDDDDQAAVEREQLAQADDADFEGVPEIMTELFALPYVFGPVFLDAVLEEGGDDAVDDAFRDPPTTEEQLLDPRAFFDGDDAGKVTVPKLRDGDEALDPPEDFGMLSLLLVLGERIPFPQAWAAVDGWRGDSSRTYRSDGKDCIRIRTMVDTPEDAEELLAAVEAWGGGRPSITGRRTARVVELSSCDPGTATSGAPTGRPRTFQLVQLRVELLSQLEQSGLPHEVAECVSDATLRDHDPQALLDTGTIEDPEDPRIVQIQRDVADAIAVCRGD